MEDGEEPMDVSFEENEFEDPDDETALIELIPVLERMQSQEDNFNERKEMEIVLNAIRMLESHPYSTSQFLLNSFKIKLDKWIHDKPPTPPEVKNVKFQKKNGKLIPTWTPPDWPLSIRYSGECRESSGKREVVDQFENIEETSYELSNVSPIQYYVMTVWAVNGNGDKGEEKRSKRDILCKKEGDVFIDDTSPLRAGYEVYKGYLKTASPDPDPVAVKIVDGQKLREVKALQKLKHRNVVTYRISGNINQSRSFGNKIFIAMELCCKDTFQELVKDKKLTMHCCKISLLHMMLGLAAIHEAGFLHRDLKPQNILRSLGKYGKAGKVMKVADFGISKEMDPSRSKVSKSALEIGTDGWGSPEHYGANAEMSEKSDIFSAGLLSSFGLSHGQHVYGSEAYDWKPNIIKGYKADLSILACNEVEIAKDMILKMLERNPDNRPTAKQVLAHPFFWDDKKKLEFLHQMKDVFTPVFLGKITPEQLTRSIMDNLETKKGIFQTENGEANWVKKMDETPDVPTSFERVLLTAKGLVHPKTKYDHTSVFDLIRFIRNVEEHYRENKEFNGNRSNVWKLFYNCFPTLLCTVYNAVYEHFPLIRNCSNFPNDATRFFNDRAPYQPLPIP